MIIERAWSSVSCVAAKTWMLRESRLGDILPCACLEVKRRLGCPARPFASTGSSSLDARLRGWVATASLIEVLLDETGLGEVQLFCRRWWHANAAPKPVGEAPWLVWIAPPHELMRLP